MAITVNTTSGNSLTVTVSGTTQASFTTETTSVSVTPPASSSVSILQKGPKGDTGATGPTGSQGATGQGVPTGGSQFQILRKDTSDDYDTSWAFADRVTIEVRFDEAVSKGDPLYITGYSNGQNRITVAKADAADSAKMPSIGLAKADYSQNDNGQATCIGSLEDVNTQVSPNDFQEGDVLYVKAGGGLTNVKPTGTNLIQNVGKVGRRQQNNGEIVVMAIGRSNDVPNIPNGQAWIGNASGVATPTTLATVATSGAYSDITGTPSLAAVATSGAYSDLTGTPSLATVATSGSYNDLSDKPSIPTDTSLSDTNQTLTGNRVIDTNGNNLEIKDGTSGIITFTDATDQVFLNKVTNVQAKTASGELRFKEVPTNGTNHVSLKAPDSMSADANFILPSADGSDGELLKTDGSGNLSFTSTPRKFIQVFNQNFQDDIGTTIHYLPVLTAFEQTSVYQEEVASLMPYDGRIKSVSVRVAAVTGSGNFTVAIRTVPTGSNSNVGQAWTIEESEVLAFEGTDDYHTFHFVFDNAQHFEAGDLCTMSLQASGDPGGFLYWYVTTLVEFDTSADLGSSSTEHTSNP